MKNLPIGIQSLKTLRETHCVYVDKTELIYRLVEHNGRYFLSRPRRFGKSLLVDTIKALFEGHRSLFNGLYIEDQWDWSQTRSVIKIDFAAGVLQSVAELEKRIHNILLENQQRLAIQCDWSQHDIAGGFAHLIREAHHQSGRQVVILIDEYDKPILDNIEHPERAAEIREGLKNLYSVMKAEDSHIYTIFMTGVTKFSKVSLFSGLNQLEDISLDSRYATICGYTQHDLETSFAEHLEGVDWVELKAMYNGYQFLGEPVYNPYDILLFISKGHSFRNYWFETGSPSFLLKLFRQQCYFLPDLSDIEVGEEILDSFDVEQINPITLLFQAGYLTIEGSQRRQHRMRYRLRVPNLEVQNALYDHIIYGYTELQQQKDRYQNGLYDALISGNIAPLVATIKRLFASIPWRNFTNNDLIESEGYYASVLYAFFASLNATVIAEDITNHGQVDMTIQIEGYTYVIEIKRDNSAILTEQGDTNPALEQIQQQHYSERYRGIGKGVFELGLVFSTHARNLVQANWQQVS